mmetsp:Transcript_5359/g.21230  ORF Transcript_5359/g.21230 Transcript_5359/m.21230 type:complete len:237 (+) Transcript_5359:7458-8168(+)
MYTERIGRHECDPRPKPSFVSAPSGPHPFFSVLVVYLHSSEVHRELLLAEVAHRQNKHGAVDVHTHAKQEGLPVLRGIVAPAFISRPCGPFALRTEDGENAFVRIVEQLERQLLQEHELHRTQRQHHDDSGLSSPSRGCVVGKVEAHKGLLDASHEANELRITSVWRTQVLQREVRKLAGEGHALIIRSRMALEARYRRCSDVLPEMLLVEEDPNFPHFCIQSHSLGSRCAIRGAC